MTRTLGFAVGMPTAIDVDILVKTFGVPEVGTLISYSALSEAIKQDVKSYRFRTVVSAWKKRLEEQQNLRFETVPTEGLKVASNSRRVDMDARKMKNHIRGVGRAAKRAAATPSEGLTDEGLATKDHLVRVGGVISTHYALENRKLRQVPPLLGQTIPNVGRR